APVCTGLSPIPLTGPAPLTVSFTGSATDEDGQISNFEFTFGDGAKVSTKSAFPTSASVTHIYQTNGQYTATLKVTDNMGNTSPPSALCSSQITVSLNIGGGATIS